MLPWKQGTVPQLRLMIAIPIPIQTPHAPDGPVFDFLFFQVHLFFFHLATSRGNPGGF